MHAVAVLALSFYFKADSQQILHVAKDHQVLFVMVMRMRTTNSK